MAPQGAPNRRSQGTCAYCYFCGCEQSPLINSKTRSVEMHFRAPPRRTGLTDNTRGFRCVDGRKEEGTWCIVYPPPPPSLREKCTLCVTDLPDTHKILHLNFPTNDRWASLALHFCGRVLSRALHHPPGRLECSGFGAYALRPSENRNEYRFTNTQKRIFHACFHCGAIPMDWHIRGGKHLIP